jgi:hypothetical protein
VDKTLQKVLAAVVSLLVIGVLTVVITTDDDGKANVTITLGQPAQQRADVPNTIEVSKAAIDAADNSDVAHHDGLKDETPPGVPDAELDQARDQQDRLAATDQLPLVTPDAAPTQRGCRSRFVRNYSSRRGVRPRLFVLHYTVSPNRPGRSDVDAITALFNNPSFGASSNYVIDRDGNCNYIVRESDKAWTQAAANPVAISVEVINTGRESPYLKAAGYRQLGRVIHDAARRWHFPVRKGRVRGCSVARSGIVDHKSLGSCGGGHVDVSPFTTSAAIRAAKAAGKTGCAKRSTRSSRRRCRAARKCKRRKTTTSRRRCVKARLR